MAALSACQDASACFVPGTEPPAAERVLPALNNGQAGRDLMSAVFAGERDRVDALLKSDPQLASTGDGKFGDLLNAAIGRCDRDMVETLLARGVPPDGPRGETPLALALRANDLWFARTLLAAGAKPDGAAGANTSPMVEALSLGDWDRVKLLLDHGHDVNARDGVGDTALVTAVDMQKFSLAERLLDAGADPWAVGTTGGNAATGAAQPTVRGRAEEEQARQRVAQRLQRAGWPWPPPPLEQIRAAVIAGKWPLAGGKDPTPDWVRRKMTELHNPDGTYRRPSNQAHP